MSEGRVNFAKVATKNSIQKEVIKMSEKRCIRCGPVPEDVEVIHDKDLGDICVHCLKTSCDRVGVISGICALLKKNITTK